MSLGKFKHPGPKQPEWATFVDGRSPQFKMHNHKGHATNAISTHRQGSRVQLLRWNAQDGDWDIEYEHTPATHCERCGHKFWTGGMYDRGTVENYYDRSDPRPQYQRDIICRLCNLKDEIDRRIRDQEYHYLPNRTYGDDWAWKELPAEYVDKWNYLVDQHHEWKKEQKRLGRPGF